MHLQARLTRFGLVLLTVVPLALLGAPSQARADGMFVPCHGFGSEGVVCTIDLEGRFGVATVESNQDFQWVFILHCSSFFDRQSGANPASLGDIQSFLSCPIGIASGGVIEAI